MKPMNLQGHSRPIKKVLFSEDGEMIFTASADRNVIAWYTATGKQYKTYPHSAAVNTLTISNSSIKTSSIVYLISGDNTGCTYLWDAMEGSLLKKVEHDPILSVRALDLNDLSLLMVVYSGRTKLAQSFINVYKFDELVANYLNGNNLNSNIQYTNGNNNHNNNNKFYESGSIYSMNNGSHNNGNRYKNCGNFNNYYNNYGHNKFYNNNYNCSNNGYKSNGLNTNSNMNVNSNNNNNDKSSSTISHEQIIPYKHFEIMTNSNTKYVSAKFINDKKNNSSVTQALTCREDGYMEILNINTGKLIFENKFHEDIIFDFDFYPEKNIVLTASRDGSSCLFSLDTFEVICRMKPDNPVRHLNTCKFCLINLNINKDNNDNGDIILKCQEDNQAAAGIKVDVDSLFVMDAFKSFSDLSLSSSKENYVQPTKNILTAVVAGGMDTKIVTTSKQEGGFELIGYDLEQGNSQEFSYNFHFGPVNSIAYSPSNRMLASGSEDSSIKIYFLDNVKSLDIYK